MRQMFDELLHSPLIRSPRWSSIHVGTFLQTAVKYVNRVTLSSDIDPYVSLLAEEPLLSGLEKTVESLTLEWTHSQVSRDLAEVLSFLAHRFLDHGVVKHLRLHSHFCNFLTSLFKERCHRYKPVMAPHPRESLLNLMSDEDGPSSKQFRWDKTVCSVSHRCIDFSPGYRTRCPDLKIQRLEVTFCLLDHLLDIIDILPTFDSLTSLTLKTPCEWSFLGCGRPSPCAS